MKKVVFIFVILYFSTQVYGNCFQIVEDLKEYRDYISICGVEGFAISDTEYIIDFLKIPFIVKNISGKLLLIDGTPMCQGVLIEIRKNDTNWKTQDIHKAYTNENGCFSFEHIKDGTYCFKTTFSGFQSVLGTIVVSKKAKKNSSVVIEINPEV